VPSVGREWSFDIDASDPDGDRLRYFLKSGTGDEAEIDLNSGVLRWTPTSSNAVTFTVRVTDGNMGADEWTFTLTPQSLNLIANRPPSFVSPPLRAAVVGESYFYDADAVDPYADSLTFTLAEGPEGIVGGTVGFASPSR
jgi:hypothetical protein